LYLNQINGLYFNASHPEEATPLHLSSASYTPHWAGFLAGRLWLLYDLTGRDLYCTMARDVTERTAPTAKIVNVDTGFAIYHSACLGYQITKDDTFLTTVQTGAASLAQLYREDLGLLMLSLPERKHTDYQLLRAVRKMEALIDTGEVLDLLWWTGHIEPRYRDFAYSNMARTLDLGFVKEDGSTFQCLEIDPVTYQPKQFYTRQGYADDSVWSRGQAWAMISFATAYDITGETKFLDPAVSCTNWYIEHLPADLIPFYDFDDPNIPQVARDTSAAAIALSAMSLLCQKDANLEKRYRPIIRKTLARLVDEYLSPGAVLMGGSWGGLLREHPHEVVMPYGNYYLVEALHREMNPESQLLVFP
jgi:unsaturated chondroitin disaccharide hydrolase